MNLILFNHKDEAKHLKPTDARVTHIRKVLRMSTGDSLYVGVLNDARGMARIVSDDEHGLTLDIQWENPRPALAPIHLLVATPRPQTARKLLFECTTLGAARIDFYQGEKSEASYAQSSLWKTDEWVRILKQGAEQAFCTHLPEVQHFGKLRQALQSNHTQHKTQIALDNYEATSSLSDVSIDPPTHIVIGGERGFSARERDTLREKAYTLCHLGERVLRTETAATAALTLALHKLKLF